MERKKDVEEETDHQQTTVLLTIIGKAKKFEEKAFVNNKLFRFKNGRSMEEDTQ